MIKFVKTMETGVDDDLCCFLPTEIHYYRDTTSDLMYMVPSSKPVRSEVSQMMAMRTADGGFLTYQDWIKDPENKTN